MPLKYKNHDVYPLEIYRAVSEGETVYDRDTRGKSYFYLSVVMARQGFITADGKKFDTVAGDTFEVLY